jgi:hypothetical protein
MKPNVYMATKIDETIDEIRAIRTSISLEFNNDVRQLASYYQQLEQRSASANGSDHEDAVSPPFSNSIPRPL